MSAAAGPVDLLVFGPHPDDIEIGIGGTGDSLTGAFLAARVLVRALQGQAEKSDQVFGWTR